MTLTELLILGSLVLIGQAVLYAIAVYFDDKCRSENYQMSAIIKIIKHRFDSLGLTDANQYRGKK